MSFAASKQSWARTLSSLGILTLVWAFLSQDLYFLIIRENESGSIANYVGTLRNVRCRQPLSRYMPRWRRVMECDFLSDIIRDHVMHPNPSVRLVYGRCCKFHIAFYHCDANAFGQRTMFIVGSLEWKAGSWLPINVNYKLETVEHVCSLNGQLWTSFNY